MKRGKIAVVFVLLVLVFYTKGFAQQDPNFTQYTYNMNVLNPAYAGSQETLSIGLLYRQQWAGFVGAPETITAVVHSPIARKVGLGISFISDKIGPVSESNVYADFSYTINIGLESKLAFGLKGGVTLLNFDFKDAISQDLTDTYINNNIPITSPNLGAGVYFYGYNYFVGLSAGNILETRHRIEGEKVTKATDNIHYYLTGGYVFDISDSVKLKPSTMVKIAPNSPLSFDVGVNALLYDRFEVGLSWRSDDAISGMMNFLITPSLRLGYAYDYTISEVGKYVNGSHEVFLLYNFDFSGRGKSPRFF